MSWEYLKFGDLRIKKRPLLEKKVYQKVRFGHIFVDVIEL